MEKKNELSIAKNVLCQGGMGVLMTDIMYGVVGSALLKNAVERIYSVRERNTKSR
ncbi:MAG: hypothetical protein AAB920_02485 [Patescibacteria group bacterium]